MLHYLRDLVLVGSLVTAHAAIAATSGEHAHHHSGHDHTRPDSHAPIGVMGDHLVPKGEIMLSYRNRGMDGNRTGTDRVDALADINFVAPNLKSPRLAAGAGIPVHQDLDGPRLETDLVFTLGAQFTF